MRTSVVGVVVIAVAVVSAVVAGLLRSEDSAQGPREDGRASASSPGPPSAAGATQPEKLENIDAQLTERLKTLCSDAGGDIGVAVRHQNRER